MLIDGKALNQAQLAQVLNAYTYRWTTGNHNRIAAYGHCPHCDTPGGKPSKTNIECRQVHPTIPLQTDTEWVYGHAFHFIADGSRLMANRNHAEPVYMTV